MSFIYYFNFKQRIESGKERSDLLFPPGEGGGTPYNGLYGEAPPERGNFFRLQLYERVGVSRAEVYERVGKSTKIGQKRLHIWVRVVGFVLSC